MTRRNVYRERTKDREFAEAWDEAKKLGLESLEAEAIRRAVRGTEKPVFHQGEQVATVREYSDVLLIFLMKAADPAKYRENYRVQIEPVSAPVPQQEGGFFAAMKSRMESAN